jgi:hypothetical protein
MPSDKQLQANRQNARRSTSPRTPQVKARASLNAVSHGLLACQSVIPKRNAPSSPLSSRPSVLSTGPSAPNENYPRDQTKHSWPPSLPPPGIKTGSPQSENCEANPVFGGLMEATASAGPFSEEAKPASPVSHATQSKSTQKQNAAIEPIMAPIPKEPRHFPPRKRTHCCPSATLRRRRHGSAGRSTAEVANPRNENAIIAVRGLRSEPNSRPPAAPPQAPSAPLGAPPPASAVLAPMEGGPAHPCPARPPVLLSSVLGSNGRFLFPS